MLLFFRNVFSAALSSSDCYRRGKHYCGRRHHRRYYRTVSSCVLTDHGHPLPCSLFRISVPLLLFRLLDPYNCCRYSNPTVTLFSLNPAECYNKISIRRATVTIEANNTKLYFSNTLSGVPVEGGKGHSPTSHGTYNFVCALLLFLLFI